LEGGVNPYAYVGNHPLRFTDPQGLNPIEGALTGAEIGFTVAGPPGAVVGAVVGAGVGLVIYYVISEWIDALPAPVVVGPGATYSVPNGVSCSTRIPP
jgi:hypothetical protein